MKFNSSKIYSVITMLFLFIFLTSSFSNASTSNSCKFLFTQITIRDGLVEIVRSGEADTLVAFLKSKEEVLGTLDSRTVESMLQVLKKRILERGDDPSTVKILKTIAEILKGYILAYDNGAAFNAFIQLVRQLVRLNQNSINDKFIDGGIEYLVMFHDLLPEYSKYSANVFLRKLADQNETIGLALMEIEKRRPVRSVVAEIPPLTIIEPTNPWELRTDELAKGIEYRNR